MEQGYSFEEYVWARGVQLGGAWHAVRPTAIIIFDNETEELPAAEIRLREFSRGVLVLTDLPPKKRLGASAESTVEQHHEPAQDAAQATDNPRARLPTPAVNEHPEAMEGLQHLDAHQQLISGTFNTADNVSALARRSIHVLVKGRSTRKRARVSYAEGGSGADDNDDDDGDDGGDDGDHGSEMLPKDQHDGLPRSNKQKKVTGTTSARATSRKRPAAKRARVKKDGVADDVVVDGTADNTNNEPAHTARNTARRATATTRRVATKTPRAAPARADNPVKIPPTALLDPFFMSVVNGVELPITRDQAIQAFAERKRRMRDAHESRLAFDKKIAAAVKRKKGKETSGDYIADMMPEFFEPSNFVKGQDPVRCACGAEDDADYEGIWIGCSTKSCKVWQHSDCMGEAVPENIKGQPYYCHNCDPWGHRVLIQRLRKGEEISPNA